MDKSQEMLKVLQESGVNEFNKQYVFTEGFNLDTKKMDGYKISTDGTFVGKKTVYRMHKEDIADAAILKLMTDAIKLLEKEYPKYDKDIQSEILKKYDDWLNDNQKSSSYINGKLKIISIEVTYHEKDDSVYITLWRQNYSDFLGNHSPNSVFKFINSKIEAKNLIMLEG